MPKILIEGVGDVSLELARQVFTLGFASSIAISTATHHAGFIRHSEGGKTELILHPQVVFWLKCPCCDGMGNINTLGNMADKAHKQRCIERLIE